ncbi:hypothetical protein GCM10007320_37270 [Pseudorhodoferax aquiterrae]|uniref:Chemotaxis protein CheZ n=1 Tax=Pseudorhodoferax aquiterrae TaxID=747304 RepID=A0ABQ3G665_9BURK|nr:hypothetical protein [Pseudorhodoferax aquiterrae]GHC89538.1 hypothetical protein GCM10007320_37270 [Pseudorhodoferax aquiterrae]
MSAESEPSQTPAVQLPVMVVADLQDSLMVVMHDLQRLDSLLAHTMDNLMQRFDKVHSALAEPQHHEAMVQVRGTLRDAVTELQFQDMASQLIAHTTKVLQGCAYKLAAESMGQGPEEEEAAAAPFGAPTNGRPNPVTQSEMDAGSIELF